MSRGKKNTSHLLGLGLDNDDGHKRVTQADQFSILGGSLLPCVIGMVFKVSNSKAALASFTGGTIASLVWIFFFHFKEAKLFGVSQVLFDTPVTMLGRYSFIDTVIPALIVSSIIFYTYNRFVRESNE